MCDLLRAEAPADFGLERSDVQMRLAQSSRVCRLDPLKNWQLDMVLHPSKVSEGLDVEGAYKECLLWWW